MSEKNERFDEDTMLEVRRMGALEARPAELPLDSPLVGTGLANGHSDLFVLELGFNQKITGADTYLLVLLPVYISYHRHW